MANRRERQTNSGAELRAIRQQLGWSPLVRTGTYLWANDE